LYLVIFCCEKIICELRISLAFEIWIESWMIVVYLWISKGGFLKFSNNCLPFAFDSKISFPHYILYNIQWFLFEVDFHTMTLLSFVSFWFLNTLPLTWFSCFICVGMSNRLYVSNLLYFFPSPVLHLDY